MHVTVAAKRRKWEPKKKRNFIDRVKNGNYYPRLLELILLNRFKLNIGFKQPGTLKLITKQ